MISEPYVSVWVCFLPSVQSLGVVHLKNPSHELGIELPVNDGYVKTR